MYVGMWCYISLFPEEFDKGGNNIKRINLGNSDMNPI